MTAHQRETALSLPVWGSTPRLDYRLARLWGIPEVFPDHLRGDVLTFMQAQREELPLAGDLAVDHSLDAAHAAFDDLRALAGAHGWHGDAWEGLLWGDAHAPGSPGYTAIADLDRRLLRSSWFLGWGDGEGFKCPRHACGAAGDPGRPRCAPHVAGGGPPGTGGVPRSDTCPPP